MNKAFVKESDADPDDDLDDAGPAIPPGSKNYMTPDGHARLEREFRTLLYEERPKVVEVVSWAAGNGDRSENGDYIYGKKRLREIDRRVRYIMKRLEIAEIVRAEDQTNRDQVFFGATVTYADEEDRERTVRIVGVNEARHELGEVSWVSPIAKALMRARVGDVVTLRLPAGPQDVEVVAIAYDGDGA